MTGPPELLTADDPRALEAAALALRRGAIVGIPTETVYGLAVLPTAAGLERLIEAKRRSAEKGIQLLIDSIDQARSVAVLTPDAERLAALFWPGPLTLVLGRRGDLDLPELLGGGRPTLGLRLPDHAVPRALARLLGPIAASSANISGQPDATTPSQVVKSVGDVVDVVLDDGPVRGGVPSSVVACLDGQPPQVLRPGALEQELRAALRE
ncbi:MAG: L-threonylcarbamoyladenylate synthase [Chloroflexota bacterium]|nr:L-threonylcarbamoyladenylate synthase [Chloroflexota bacterium]